MTFSNPITEPGIDWAATFSKPGPGGSVAVVYCTAFAEGGRSWGEVCSRCGVISAEHVSGDGVASAAQTQREPTDESRPL